MLLNYSIVGFQRIIRDLNITGTEVYLADKRGVNAAQIKNKLTVNVKPHIVVAGKFEYDVMSPCVLAVFALNKARFHLHTEEVLRISV